MRICLILPPNRFLQEEKRNCPLGILYVAAALEKQDNKVVILDLRDHDGEFYIPQFDIYGISSSIIEYEDAKFIAKAIRNEYHDAHIVLGGPATLINSEFEDFDLVVKGEGEFVNLANSGIVLADRRQDLNDLPLPARHLLPYDSVVSKSLCHPGKKATTIMAGRGCPYNCTYCSSPIMWNRRNIMRDPSNVAQEIKTLQEDYGIEELRFQDDELNLSPEWLWDLAKVIPKDISFRCNARAEAGNFIELKEAGCYEVGIGVETANSYAHKIHKGTDLDRTLKGIWNAYIAGLNIRIFMIHGLPYDNNTPLQTIKWLSKLPPSVIGIHLNILSPFTGCRIGNFPLSFGMTINDTPKSILLQNEPYFTYTLKDINNEDLISNYKAIRKYLAEKGLTLP